MRSLAIVASLTVVAVAAVEQFGWLNGAALTCALYILMPYEVSR